mgnify:CR=1 FL=1
MRQTFEDIDAIINLSCCEESENLKEDKGVENNGEMSGGSVCLVHIRLKGLFRVQGVTFSRGW